MPRWVTLLRYACRMHACSDYMMLQHDAIAAQLPRCEILSSCHKLTDSGNEFRDGMALT
jgi:hypothetical protein